MQILTSQFQNFGAKIIFTLMLNVRQCWHNGIIWTIGYFLGDLTGLKISEAYLEYCDFG
jgi:CYTH domain-containing protein